MARRLKTPKSSIETAWHLAIIFLVGIVIYSNTLTSSFQFDDKLNIVENLLIRDIRNLWPPQGGRWFGFLTFSLNYMVGGLNTTGYHLVNTGIHIFTAVSVYFFVLLTLGTPYFCKNKNCVVPDRWFAFSCAILFVAHPIQTQAITYIVQRFASLMTLLFILSLDFYIWARLTAVTGEPGARRGTSRFNCQTISLYAASCVCAVASLKTKENSFTLPVVIVLYDAIFLYGFITVPAILKKWWRTVASLIVLLCAGMVYAVKSYDVQRLFDTFKATNEITRHDYLVTQFRVIVTYIRLLFLPVNQTIDHHYRVYVSVFEPSVFASLVMIVLLLSVAGYLLWVSREGASYLRLVSFGIFWFFITLSIESSFIPIIDIMFEHRLYLPSIGVIIAIIGLFVHLFQKGALIRCRSLRPAACILAIVVLALSCTTYQRNKVWKNELTLWSDAIAKKTDNPRAYNMVGIYYQAHASIFDAITYFRKALEVDSSYAEARSNLGNAYVQAGRVDEGLKELMIAAQSNRFDAIDTGILYYNIGKGFQRKGMPGQAIEYLNSALSYIPQEAAVFFLLGEIYKQQNMIEQSKVCFKTAHELDPEKY